MTRRFFPMTLKILTLVMMLAVVAPVSSHAQDGAAQGAAKTDKKPTQKSPQKLSEKSVEVSADHLYAPENCEMQIGFPKPPQIQRKCGTGPDSANSAACTEVVTYREERTTPPPAQVGKDEKSAPSSSSAPPAAALSSLSVRVTCQDYTPSQLESFNDDVLKSALDQMLREQNYESYRDFTVDTTAGLRRASSMSLGTLNNVDHLYTGQIWKGAHSLFTLEAQMIGPSNPDIEKTFVAILRATHPKQTDPHRQPSSPKPDKNQAQ